MLNKLFPLKPVISIVFCMTFLFMAIAAAGQGFIHPGILHSESDLLRMKKSVENKMEPVYSGYGRFIQDPASQFTYQMQGPLSVVARNPTVGQAAYDNDANAAHQNAVMWAITGDKRYADKAIEIVNAWTGTLKSIQGKDAVLMAGLGPFKMINAAEILRYTGSGWKNADIQQAEKHFKEVVYPVLKDFAPFANGNWDAAAMKTMMAIAVFCNDRPMFEKALDYYVNGAGNGRLTYYVVNEEGQVQESGRDQPHTQLGIGMLAECCAIAWNQGLDLYGYCDSRLLKGFEYTAKFNLGNDVPFTEWLDRTGKYHHTKISQQGRGDLRAVYEQVYNHYAVQKGLSAVFIQQVVEKIRPEGPGKPGADHPGYGTLYFASKEKTVPKNQPVPPSAITAITVRNEITLTWVKPIGAEYYTVKRATKAGGPYSTIATNIRQADFTDRKIRQGITYYYTITASNKKGVSPNSCETPVGAGLPVPWKQQDIGKGTGSTSFNGKTFTIEATGGELAGGSDDMHFTYRPVKGSHEIIARFVPQTNSQFSQMGLTMREGPNENSAFVSLVLFPAKTADIELPGWRVKLVSRNIGSGDVDTSAIDLSVSDPAVTWGRLTGYVWLRLQRYSNRFTGSFSYDGKAWKELPVITSAFKADLLSGIAVSSCMPNSTVVSFDQISISGRK